MRVLHVCSELFPLLKTGGLADVIGALPAAQLAEGADVRIILPAFPDLRRGIPETVLVREIDTFAGRVALRYGHYRGIGIYLIDAPALYDRAGSPYHDASLYAYSDNYLRFALLGWMACELACGLDGYWRPEVVHAHDWHAGLTCAYLAARGRPARSVFTVHNLAYQGLFSADHLSELHLPAEFSRSMGWSLRADLLSESRVVLCRPCHDRQPDLCKEITQPAFGYGMEGLLQALARQGRLTGILNGVDSDIWDPQSDTLLPTRYDAENLQAKAINKTHLQTAMGLQLAENKPILLLSVD